MKGNMKRLNDGNLEYSPGYGKQKKQRKDRYLPGVQEQEEKGEWGDD